MTGTKIKDYPKYTITEDGKVFSTARGKEKELKPQKVSQSKKKYLQVRLFNKQYPKGRLQYVHRLVWQTFKGEIHENYEIDHIDNNPRNNHIDNLRLITREDNMLKYNRIRYGDLGRDLVKQIREYQKQGLKVQQIADKLGKSYTAIYRIVTNQKQVYKTVNGKRHYYLIPFDYDKLL